MRTVETVKLWRFTREEDGHVLEIHAKTRKGAWGALRRLFKNDQLLEGYDKGKLIDELYEEKE